MNVKTFDNKHIKTLVNNAPVELQEYIQALRNVLDNQADITNTAISKIRKQEAELTRKNEALEDCMTIALHISSGDLQTGLAAKAILAVVEQALKEVE